MHILSGSKIELRQMEPNDVDLLYNWENDSSIWQLSNTTTPFSKFYLEQFILNSTNDIYTDKQLRLIAVLKDNKELAVGCIDFFDFDPKNLRAGIGILIDKNHRKRGYGSEVLDIIIKYSKNTLNLHQIFCNIGADNTESLKLFKNKGFEIAGLKKEWVKKPNKWEDEYLLQLFL